MRVPENSVYLEFNVEKYLFSMELSHKRLLKEKYLIRTRKCRFDRISLVDVTERQKIYHFMSQKLFFR